MSTYKVHYHSHSYTSTYIRTHIQTQIRTHTQTHSRSYTNTHAFVLIRKHIRTLYANTLICTHTHICIYTQTRTFAFMNKHTFSLVHTRIRTCTNTSSQEIQNTCHYLFAARKHSFYHLQWCLLLSKYFFLMQK